MDAKDAGDVIGYPGPFCSLHTLGGQARHQTPALRHAPGLRPARRPPNADGVDAEEVHRATVGAGGRYQPTDHDPVSIIGAATSKGWPHLPLQPLVLHVVIIVDVLLLLLVLLKQVGKEVGRRHALALRRYQATQRSSAGEVASEIALRESDLAPAQRARGGRRLRH